MDEEMESLLRNKTRDLVEFLKGKLTLQNKWVYRLKEEDGDKKRYKDILVGYIYHHTHSFWSIFPS